MLVYHQPRCPNAAFAEQDCFTGSIPRLTYQVACTDRKGDESGLLPEGWKRRSEGDAFSPRLRNRGLSEGGVWSGRHGRPLCSEQELSEPPGGEMGRSGTHPRAPPPAPKLQIFKLCRLAIIPQSQLLQAVGARCSRPHITQWDYSPQPGTC